ncbi:MAG: endolytic transglycosylase MltG [Candidatus Nomurabacteria bacterium]|nr:endolytic transglycosylase MltG [Candidatus Nomurabacteria bacterium]
MKLKYLATLLVLLIGTLLGIVYYYGLDPALLTKLSFYENLANPSVRIVRVQEGLRKEEIAEVMFNKLDWGEAQKNDFINTHLALNSTNSEGYYFPKTYLINKDETPSEVSITMFDEFSKQTDKIKKPKTAQIINEDTAIKIASIIQRESGGKDDMRLISGIIWNRIFNGMKLQIDATLQYAKGSEEEGWWRQVTPEDKKIKSSYNTYLHAGLPPGAIANPGLDAILAAYNPQKTKCMFYLHDKNRNIHCAITYEEHKKNIQKYY